MDHELKAYIDALGAVARQESPADARREVEQYTKEYLRNEIARLEAGIKRARDAIEAAEKRKADDEDWSLIQDYINWCVKKQAIVFEAPSPPHFP